MKFLENKKGIVVGNRGVVGISFSQCGNKLAMIDYPAVSAFIVVREDLSAKRVVFPRRQSHISTCCPRSR